MIYTIFNQFLSVSIDSLGAQLRSVMSADGTEYLWQGDARYWADSSPVLFPYIARLYEKSYTYHGQRYSMDIHGFAASCEFEAETHSDESVTMILRENSATLEQYPFSFELSITYSLSASTLNVHYNLKNTDSKTMPFALGAHPGFNVPVYEDSVFEDYYICFDEPCCPLRIGFTDELFLSGETTPYPLEDGRLIRLRHELFDKDAIILSGTAKKLRLGCSRSQKHLTMSFAGFEYFGIWHAPQSDAPYVCLEPWTSLPSRQGIIEDMAEKEDMIRLQAGEEYKTEWFLTVSEG